MKKIFFIIVTFIIAYNLQAQSLQWNEYFESGKDSWIGDVNDFTTTGARLNLEAQQNVADTKYLSKSSNIVKNATWEFLVELNINPSSNNYCEVYLMSNSSNLTGSGYYVRLGSTNDDITLNKRDQNGVTTNLITGFNKFLNKNSSITRIKVTRTGNEWELWADTIVAETKNYKLGGTKIESDNIIETSNFFGVKCIFTQTNYKNKFHFDDIEVSGEIVLDLVPPKVIWVLPIADTITKTTKILRATFSKEINFSELSSTNFNLSNGYGNPTNIQQKTANIIDLIYAQDIDLNSDYSLTMNNIKDISGNILSTSYPLKNLSINWSDDFYYLKGWIGDTLDFNANGTLDLKAPNIAATKYISRNSKISQNATWEFWVKLDFNPSSTNYCDVFLMSNSSDLTGNVSGYYVRLGTNNDNIALYRTGHSIALVQSPNKILDKSVSITRVKVTRNENNFWSLFVDLSGGYNYELVDSTFQPDNTFETGKYFGIKCVFTSGNSNNKFHFDDIVVSGNIVEDNVPPYVVDVYPWENELKVTFSEDIDISNAYFELDCAIGNPDNVEQNPLNIVTLSFSFSLNALGCSNFVLTIKGVKDLSGNIMPDTKFPFKLAPDENDIIITEIMAKPATNKPLPNVKYVELYNRSSTNVNLKNWTIKLNNNNEQKITTTDFILQANHYVVLCRKDSIYLFPTDLNISFVEMSGSFPSPNVSGGTLTLKDNLGNIVNTVTYSDSWYNDEFKKSDGGWSLEMIDFNSPCVGTGNWTASKDPNGGTPGKINSVNGNNPDITAPFPTIVDVIDAKTIDVYFNEALKKTTIENINSFSVVNQLNKQELGGKPISAVAAEPDYSKVRLTFSQQMKVNEIYDLIIIDSISDCCGNIVTINSKILFGLADSVCFNDLIINELLFNPYTGSQDFIELYNRSDKLLDLKYLTITSRNSTTGELTYKKSITETSHFIFPQNYENGRFSYCVLSTKIDNLSNNYTIEEPENLFVVSSSSFPSMPNSNATIVLMHSANVDPKIIIDEVCYDEKQHSKLLSSKKGVSLERICPNRKSNDITNWHSASQNAGFATPGYQNSQYSCDLIINHEIQVSPETFSPDNDGYQDIINISYKLKEPGYTASMSIYNSSGSFIKEIVNHELLGTEGNYTWDGFNERGELCPIGIYILYVEMFNINGNKIKEKKAFVLSQKNSR